MEIFNIYTTSRSSRIRGGWRNFLRAFASICLTLSRVTPIMLPTSSSVSWRPGQCCVTHWCAWCRRNSDESPVKVGSLKCSILLVRVVSFKFRVITQRDQCVLEDRSCGFSGSPNRLSDGLITVVFAAAPNGLRKLNTRMRCFARSLIITNFLLNCQKSSKNFYPPLELAKKT